MYAHEFALLIAITTPIAVVVSNQVGLWAAGERDTLLIPVVREYPRAEVVDTLAAEFQVFAPAKARNDEHFRLAA